MIGWRPSITAFASNYWATAITAYPVCRNLVPITLIVALKWDLI